MTVRKIDGAQLTYRAGLPGKVRVTFRLNARTSFSWKMPKTRLDTICDLQQQYAVPLMSSGGRSYWIYKDRFYWDNEDLDAETMLAVLAIRDQRNEQRLARARETYSAGGASGRRGRGAIPEDVKHLVWVRDMGRCRHCGAQVELQFDHIIPVAMGGASTPENLQILCGACNRRKAAGVSFTD